MLKRFFLSIIILSALASEGGVYFSAGIFDCYLVNLAQLDIMQDGGSLVSGLAAQKMAERKGTPAAFYRNISQNAIEGKDSKPHNGFGNQAVFVLPFILAFIVVSYLYLSNKISFNAGRTLLSLTDSSPPAFC